MICTWILTPIMIIIRGFVELARTIIETVCEWVSTVIRTVKTIVERICSWLPWPLDELCNLVTKVIEVFETVWDLVCHEVVRIIFEIIEWIIITIEYILKWICWLIDWILFRWIDYLLCQAGFEPQRCLRICIKVLSDAARVPAATNEEVDAAVAQARLVLSNCNIDVVEQQRTVVQKDEFMTSTTCDTGNMFSAFFRWMSWNTCKCCNTVTVYFVRSMTNAGGCAFPGTDFVIVANDRAAAQMGNTMVQEIGHLCDLWDHSSDPNNVMTDQPGGTADQITEHQCCIIRSSRFVRACLKH